MTTPNPEPWFVYLLECQRGVWYAGIAKDVQARFVQHQQGKGAKFTKANPPLRILAQKKYANHGEALKAEAQLKKLPKSKKMGWFTQA